MSNKYPRVTFTFTLNCPLCKAHPHRPRVSGYKSVWCWGQASNKDSVGKGNWADPLLEKPELNLPSQLSNIDE
jgi:hypothetical protein